jgi:hypothetical protein
MKLYVKAQSKKHINERILAGQTVYGENFSMFGGGGAYALDSSLPAGTIIAVFQKTVGGSPYATAFGTWSGSKVK